MQRKAAKAYGRLVVRSIPGPEVEERVADYLQGLMKRVPPERIRERIRKPPVVLARKVSAKKAARIVAELENLGARAAFVPVRPAQLKEKTGSGRAPRVVETQVALAAPPGRLRKKRLKAAAALLVLAASLSFLGFRIYDVLNRPTPAEQVMRPIRSESVSVTAASPGQLQDLFFLQYRLSPDTRLIQAFAVLAERYGLFHGLSADPGFRLGPVTANNETLLLPLLAGGDAIEALSLPLPLSFAEAAAGLDRWHRAMERHLKKTGGGMTVLSDSGADPARRPAPADPTALLDSLLEIQRVWNRSGPRLRLLQEASRRYAVLATVLHSQDFGAADGLAAFALALTAVCRPVEGGGAQRIERALLARAMGYEPKGLEAAAAAEGFQERLLYAFLQEDTEKVASMVEEGGKLARYLLIRLHRLGLRHEQADAETERLLKGDPHFFPAIADAVFSANLSTAKRYSVLYPIFVFSKAAAGPLPAGGPIEEWTSLVSWFGGEKTEADLSISRFEAMLKERLDAGATLSQGVLFDAERTAAVWRSLYLNALYLRFRLLSERWHNASGAQAFAELLADKDPGHPLVLAMLARSAENRREPETAASYLAAMLEQADVPGSLAAWVYEGIEPAPLRIRLWPEVLDRIDGRPGGFAFAGGALYRLLNLDLAETYTRTAVGFDSRRFEGYRRLAAIRGDDAALAEALRAFPDEARLLMAAGDHYAAGGTESKKKALDIFRRVKHLVPENRHAFTQSVTLLRELGRAPEALEALLGRLNNAGRGPQTDLGLRILLARIYLELGDPDKALAAVEAEIRSYRPAALLIAAQAHEALGKLKTANEYFRLAAMRSAGSEAVLLPAAVFFWRQGADRRAAGYLAELRAQSPAPLFYESEFADALSGASLKRLISAAEELVRTGAGFGEIHRLAVHYADTQRTAIALRFLDLAPAADAAQEMERTVTRYVIIGLREGENRAAQFLADSVPPDRGSLLARILFERGLFAPILEEFVAPEFHPVGSREHVWLYRTAAWLALGKASRWIGDLVNTHYQEAYRPTGDPDHPLQRIEAVYHATGRFLIGGITLEELFAVSPNPEHRCLFAYFVGLSHRLKGDFAAGTRWYEICRSTLQTERLEYRWATRELARWQDAGIRHRQRLWKDPFGVGSGPGQAADR